MFRFRCRIIAHRPVPSIMTRDLVSLQTSASSMSASSTVDSSAPITVASTGPKVKSTKPARASSVKPAASRSAVKARKVAEADRPSSMLNLETIMNTKYKDRVTIVNTSVLLEHCKRIGGYSTNRF